MEKKKKKKKEGWEYRRNKRRKDRKVRDKYQKCESTMKENTRDETEEYRKKKGNEKD